MADLGFDISSLWSTTKLYLHMCQSMINTVLFSLDSNRFVAGFVNFGWLGFCLILFCFQWTSQWKGKKKSSSAKEIKCFLSICMASRWKLISSACRKTATMKTITEKQATHRFVPTKYYLNLTHFNYLCNQIINENHTALKIPLMF